MEPKGKREVVEKEIETRLTVQIHHRVGLAPFKVLISRILRPAAGLCRRRVCKHIQHYFPFHLNIAKKIITSKTGKFLIMTK